MPSVCTCGQQPEADVQQCAIDILAMQGDAEKKNPSALVADVTVAASAWSRFKGFDIYEVEAVVREVLEAASQQQGDVTCRRV